ncbi:MAG TPA: hypothetical protein PL001_12290 [Candidatus Kryptobacter bacterium]|nr:hypothetical protein [Candidatus Kryptobacter bacterium]
MNQDEEKKNREEVLPLNRVLFEELSIEELEKRLELDAPKTCGQYTTGPGTQPL